tara:strand:+ start:438 stop:3083 length:2646 start_codon:yes stop_codon:yes gene_type:complete
MSDSKYQSFLNEIDNLFANNGINPKSVREIAAESIFSLDYIHESTKDFLLDEYVRGKLGPGIEDTQKFILDLLEILPEYKELNLISNMLDIDVSNNGIGFYPTASMLENADDVMNPTGDLIYQIVKNAGNLDDELKLILDNNQPFLDEALEVFNKLPVSKKIESLETLQELTDVEGKKIGLNIGMIKDSIIEQYFRIQSELTRGFLGGESLGNRLMIELNNAVDVSKDTGKIIEDIIDNFEMDNLTGDYKNFNNKSMSDIMEFQTDDVFYGVRNMLNQYMKTFRKEYLKYLNGDFSDLYGGSIELMSNYKINKATRRAAVALVTNVQDEDFVTSNSFFKRLAERNLSFTPTGRIEPFFATLKEFTSDVLELKKDAEDDFRMMANSDSAIRTAGVPIQYETDYITKRNLLKTNTPKELALLDIRGRALNVFKNNLGVDNYSSIFDIAVTEPMHMTPTVALLDYVEKNPDFKVEVLDSRTAKFFDVSNMTRGNAQLQILKQGIGGKPNLFNIPDTELREIPKKAPGGPTPLGERYMDSLILRVTPNNPGQNVVNERLRLERIIKNKIQTPPLQEGLLKRYLDYDEFIKGLPADRAEQLLDYTNKEVADKLELFKDQYNLTKPYGPGELESINIILFDYKEPSPIEDAVLADIENWDLDAEGNPIDPRKKPEGMSNFQKELSAQYNYLLESDTPTNAVDDVQRFIKNLPQDYFTPPEFRKIADTPEDIARSVDKNKLAQAEDVLKNTDVGRHISGTALDFAKKAGKVGFGTGMTAVAPGDVIIEQGIKRLLPKLGLAFISAPALAAYTAYEMALLAADVGKGLSEAKNRGDEESFKSAFWDGFTEDAYSDKYSIGYALTKEIHETLFQDVYGRIAQEYLPGSED